MHGVYKSDGVVSVLISYGSSAHGQGCVSAPEGEMSSSVINVCCCHRHSYCL